MTTRTFAYVTHAFVADALRLGWCGVSDAPETHHCSYSQLMWRCTCERSHIVPAGMRRKHPSRVGIDGLDVPAAAGCWGGSAP